jgi:hypothetical protein
MTPCGHEKHYDTLRPPLVCNQPAGHPPPHGISRELNLPPYVTWKE